MNNEELPFKDTGKYRITGVILVFATMLIFAFFSDFACKRISGSDKHVDLIKKEVSLFSFPENVVFKGDSVIHRYNKITYEAFYGASSHEHYNDNNVYSYYMEALRENKWHFVEKRSSYNVMVKKNQNTYTWKKNDYKLVIEIYSSINGLESYFDSLGYEKNDFIYSIKIYW